MLTRIVVADDNQVRREGLRRLLEAEPGWSVVASGAFDAIEELLGRHEPDVLVVSTARGSDDVEDALARADHRCAGLHSVVISPHRDLSSVSAVLQAGAAAYVLSEDVLSGVLEAVRMTGEPAPYLSTTLAARLATDNPVASRPALDEREEKVLRLVALGYTNVEVAGRLSLSVRTIEAQRGRLQRKLGAGNRVELVRAALARGLIDRHDGTPPG
ncbi:MAG: two component transcriptional regulator, LuxR family [Solirubrobacterales bacterium]|jgi:DNA-binding NarL/FixJ family response regulator|nr:two component transcriptional regulator, LuxR family [Solirubrobacterales bacterium]